MKTPPGGVLVSESFHQGEGHRFDLKVIEYRSLPAPLQGAKHVGGHCSGGVADAQPPANC